LLHDVGKAFVPSRILAKPDRLTDEEFAIVREHPRHGFEALDATGC
jgi:HD-GYP domain-containing protein (c-di-GMP phosphodiesterase class II)